jgi:hypothetical protein
MMTNQPTHGDDDFDIESLRATPEGLARIEKARQARKASAGPTGRSTAKKRSTRRAVSAQSTEQSALSGVSTPWSLSLFTVSSLSEGHYRYGSKGRFIPAVPMEWLQLVDRLGTGALLVAAEIWRRVRMKGSPKIELPMMCLKGIGGRDRNFVRRGLEKLEKAGVVKVARPGGAAAPVVTALDRPWAFEQPAELPDHKHETVMTPAGPVEQIGACPRCAFENGDRVIVRRPGKNPVTLKNGVTYLCVWNAEP